MSTSTPGKVVVAYLDRTLRSLLPAWCPVRVASVESHHDSVTGAFLVTVHLHDPRFVRPGASSDRYFHVSFRHVVPILHLRTAEVLTYITAEIEREVGAAVLKILEIPGPDACARYLRTLDDAADGGVCGVVADGLEERRWSPREDARHPVGEL